MPLPTFPNVVKSLALEDYKRQHPKASPAFALAAILRELKK